MITSFVLVMMLLIEYINVQTRGSWQQALRKSRSGQILLGAALGATPGCLGAFTVVSLYSHRSLSFSALVAAMIATSGDESFVLFSMVPAQAVWLTAILFLGWSTSDSASWPVPSAYTCSLDRTRQYSKPLLQPGVTTRVEQHPR
jgi:hypothetical protein